MVICSSHACCWFLGSPRVENDEEEDDIDDLDNEFEYGNSGIGFDQMSENTSISRRNSGFPQSDLDSAPPGSQIPLLTYGDEVKTHPHCICSNFIYSLSQIFGSCLLLQDIEISSDRHALIVPPSLGGHGNKVHPVSLNDPTIAGKLLDFKLE